LTINRADKSQINEWWFTIDGVLLSAIVSLIVTGLVLSLAASPSVAMRAGLPPYHFVINHALYSALALAVVMTVSLFEPRTIRRLALLMFAAALAAMAYIHLYGIELNGARRWLSISGHSLQPSEFAKPAFIVLSGWLLAEANDRPEMPGLLISLLVTALFAGLLVSQPDVGQTLLVLLVWSALFFASGQPIRRALMIVAAGAAGLAAAYSSFQHVRFRIDRFFNPVPGDLSQIDRAMRSFAEGGFWGRGPGEGTIKTALPDAHTDFIFAVVAEEYGIIACLALLALFAFITGRLLLRAANETDAATRLGLTGLALLFGLQALINMGVNVGLLPAKGMTLPFISSGGSSMLAVAVTLGMALALARRRPGFDRLKKPELMSSFPSA
jgi:cell division protein FtsW